MTQTPVPAFGGCPWPVDPACETAEWAAFEPAVRERALALASATLSRLSGFRVGNCAIKVRPTPQIGYCGIDVGFRAETWLPAGHWNSLLVTRPYTSPLALVLPGPIGRVDEVRIDGVVIDPALYRIAGSTLRWNVADRTWPQTQNIDLPDTEVGTFSVTYLNAHPVDSLGAYAVGLLAIEFAKACTGGRKCRLPDTVTSLVRQGVTMEIPAGSFPNGVTGIREVDSWLGLWNPRGSMPSLVWSPGRNRNPSIDTRTTP